MTTPLDDITRKLDRALVEDPAQGIYRCNREIFIDPELFDLEMKHIFEGNWIYLAHESQLAENGDYLTTWMGRQPVIVSRTRTGELAAVLNACAHRGAMVCRRKKDNRSTWTCPFHGWTYSNSGKLLKAKDAKGGGYPEQFNKDGSHDMVKVPRFESYRGFLFGSLNPDVLPLPEHLGETTKLIDLMDQFSSQIRQYRPIAVDKTEVTIHCIAPKGESAQARAARIRRYEDFFNATGMATPDDLEEFRASQNGFLAAPSAPWNDMSRGATHWIEGPDEDARAIGINPLRSGVKVEDEGLYPIQHRYWLTAMQQAVLADSKTTSQ